MKFLSKTNSTTLSSHSISDMKTLINISLRMSITADPISPCMNYKKFFD